MKYDHVLASLDPDTSVRIAPLLDDLPEADRYFGCGLSCSTFGLLEDEHVKVFSNLTALGESKPSKLMDFMLWLHEGAKPGFLMHFTLKRLLLPPLSGRHSLPSPLRICVRWLIMVIA